MIKNAQQGAIALLFGFWCSKFLFSFEFAQYLPPFAEDKEITTLENHIETILPSQLIYEQYRERVSAALTTEEWRSISQIAKAAGTNNLHAKNHLNHLCRLGEAEAKWVNSGGYAGNKGACLRAVRECYRRTSAPHPAP